MDIGRHGSRASLRAQSENSTACPFAGNRATTTLGPRRVGVSGGSFVLTRGKIYSQADRQSHEKQSHKKQSHKRIIARAKTAKALSSPSWPIRPVLLRLVLIMMSCRLKLRIEGWYKIIRTNLSCEAQSKVSGLFCLQPPSKVYHLIL